MPLTGRRRYRIGWFGRVILQVEEAYEHAGSGRPLPWRTYVGYRWRDARVEDLTLVLPTPAGTVAADEMSVPVSACRMPAHVGGSYRPSAPPCDPDQAGRVPPPSSND